MLSLLEPTLRLISYFFTGIRDLFYRPPPPPGDVERGDGELGGHLERDLASVRMNEISSEEPASDPDLSCLRDVYFVGLSRSILRSHMNTQIASTRQCLFIGAKCSRYLSVTVRVYPGIDASHGCRINDLVRYQYVEKPAEDVDLFYKKDQSAFYLIRSTDGLPLVVANDLLKMYLPHVLHGSGIRYSFGNILVVKTDSTGAVVDLLKSEEAAVFAAVGSYIKSLYIVVPLSDLEPDEAEACGTSVVNTVSS